MATIEQIQEIANQGFQDDLSPENKAKFDELVKQKLITLPESPAKEQDQTGILEDISTALEGFTAEALNTFSFGLADKVAELGTQASEALFGPSGAPSPTERRKTFREESPKSAVVASIIGGIANPVGQKVGALIAKAPGLASTVRRGMVGGAGLGAAQALGESEGDIQKRAEQTLQGAEFGAVVGGAIPLGVAGIKGVGKGIIDLLGRFSDKRQGTVALRKVAEALERDGFTPDQALERINNLGPEAALIDIGDNSRALAFTAFGIPGKGKTRIKQFLTDRQEGVRDPKTGVIKGGQVARIREHINDIVPENFFDQRQVLANINESAELYRNAFSQNQQVESNIIDRILRTPAGKLAARNARITLRNLQKNLSKVDPELTAQAKEAGIETGAGVGKGLKLEFLDQVKKELFDLETLAKTPFGKPTARSFSITQLRRDLIKEIDNVDVTAQAGPGSLKAEGGDYARARLLAGDKIANQEALERGADFMSKAKFGSPEELGIALEELTPEARHLFRVGAAQALKAKIGDTVSRADAAKKILDIPALENKIRIAFGDKELFFKYSSFMNNEKELFRAVTDVLSNSKTAERLGAVAEAGADPGALMQAGNDLGRGNLIQGLFNISKGAVQRVTTPQPRAEGIAKTLTGRSIEGLQPGPAITPVTEQLAPKGIEETLIRALAPQAGVDRP